MRPVDNSAAGTLVRADTEPARVFLPAPVIGGVEEVGRQAHAALVDRPGGASLHAGALAIAGAPRPRGPWMALTWKTHVLVTASHPGHRGPSALWVFGADVTRDRALVHRALRARALTGAELLLSVAPFAEQLLPDGHRAKLELLGPPVPDPLVTRSDSDAQEERGLRLLSVGRADARKGHDTAIHVARVLAHDRLVRLDIAGPGPDLPRLSQLVEANRHPQLDVVLHGRVSEGQKSRLYAWADALLFLPRAEAGEYEGLGLVALEAASHGCPAVVLDCGGSRYGVATGKSGQLLPAEARPADIAAAVLEVLELPSITRTTTQFASNFALGPWQERVRAVMAGERPGWVWPAA